MSAPAIGIPTVIDGVTYPHKNEYIEKILKSKALKRQKEEEENQLKMQGEQRDLNKIIEAIEKEFAKNRVENGQIIIDIRLKYIKIYTSSIYTTRDAFDSLKNQLNPMLAHKGISIDEIHFQDTDVFSDEDMACICTSLFCCCIPLVYWIPKFKIDNAYGKRKRLKFAFACTATS